MPYSSRTGIALCIVILLTGGCVIDRPPASDSEGPNIIVTLTGGAEYQFESTNRRPNQCAIVRGPILERNVDVRVTIIDPSGMAEARIVTEGDNITPGSVRHGSPDPERDIRITPRLSDPFRDQIQVDFLPLGAEVRSGAIVLFNINGTFQNGTTLNVYARDSFGNTTEIVPFRLVSDLAAPCPNR